MRASNFPEYPDPLHTFWFLSRSSASEKLDALDKYLNAAVNGAERDHRVYPHITNLGFICYHQSLLLKTPNTHYRIQIPARHSGFRHLTSVVDLRSDFGREVLDIVRASSQMLLSAFDAIYDVRNHLIDEICLDLTSDSSLPNWGRITWHGEEILNFRKGSSKPEFRDAEEDGDLPGRCLDYSVMHAPDPMDRYQLKCLLRDSIQGRLKQDCFFV